ncbi:pyruvate kinase [compost metagenome]
MHVKQPCIAATVGQLTCTAEMLESMKTAGVTLFRYNLAAQLGLSEHRRRMEVFRTVQSNSSVQSIQLLLDVPFPGAKFRIGMLPERKHLVEAGTTLTFTSGLETKDINAYVPVDVQNLGLLVDIGKVVTIGDGELAFQIDEVVDKNTFIATAVTTDRGRGQTTIMWCPSLRRMH